MSMTPHVPSGMVRRLTTRDLYRFRRVSLQAQRTALKAQSAQQVLKELTLELERRYNLLGVEAQIDIHTGEIAVAERKQM